MRCVLALALVSCAGATPSTNSDLAGADFAIPSPVDGGGRDLQPDFARPPDLASSDLLSLPPNAFSSPGPPPAIYGNAFAAPLQITIAADDPSSTLYYTTDGTTPTLASTSGATPVTGIALSTTLGLNYFASNAGGMSAASYDSYAVNTANQTGAGYLVQNVKLDGVSPVVYASPGQVLATATADIQVWVQSSHPTYAAQLVYGVDTADQGCLYDGGPRAYPGTVVTGKVFTVTAPTTPGVYEVRVAHSEQANCAAAMALGALATRPTIVRIGALVVR